MSRLFRSADSGRIASLAEAMRVTAGDLKELGVIDRIVPEGVRLADGTVQTIYNRYGIEHRAPERKD